MELNNEFVVGVSADEAWKLLTDVERIAPCMPGAELQEVEGEEYRGIVKVKVGPITAQYKGKATFVERDDGARRAVLRAEGRETRGQGNANATITAQLTPEGESTRVSVITDLTITGRAAQFGRGVLADVSAKLMGQFVQCLEVNVLSGGVAEPAGPPAAATTTGTGAGTGTRQVESRPVQPVDLLDTAGAPVLKRIVPALIGMFLAWRVVRRFRRR